MISQILMIFTLISIWLSLAWGLVILISAVQFWLKHSDFRVDTSPLVYSLRCASVHYSLPTWSSTIG